MIAVSRSISTFGTVCVSPPGQWIMTLSTDLSIAEAERERQLGLREIAAGGHDLLAKSLVAELHVDDRADRIAVGLRADEFQTQPVVAGVLVVAQEPRALADGSHHEVEIAVAVDVGECQTAADERLGEIGTGFVWRYGEEFGDATCT